MHYHYVNESYLYRIIDIVRVNSEDNIADILSKSLGTVKFVRFKKKLNII